jgi:uncharacterized membrane protein
MKLAIPVLLFAASSLVIAGFTPQGEPKKEPEINFEKEIVPIVKTNCLGCHNKDYNKKGIIFPDKMTEEEALKNPRLWRRSGRAAKSKRMPPQNGTLGDKERDLLVKWIETKFPPQKGNGISLPH